MMQQAHQQGLISPEKFYIRPTDLNEFTKLLFKLAYQHQHLPMLLDEVSSQYLKENIETDEFVLHNAQIIIPQTPLILPIEK